MEYRLNCPVDPAAVAARLAREAETDARVAQLVAAEQAELDARNEKVCLNDKECARPISQDAKRCPYCGKNQGQSGSGHMSGANRSRRSTPLTIDAGGAA